MKGGKFLNMHSVAQVIDVFEALLCFDAWLMRDIFWMIPDLCGAKSSAKASIEKLMQMCQTNIPVMKQNGWKFPKFHELCTSLMTWSILELLKTPMRNVQNLC